MGIEGWDAPTCEVVLASEISIVAGQRVAWAIGHLPLPNVPCKVQDQQSLFCVRVLFAGAGRLRDDGPPWKKRMSGASPSGFPIPEDDVLFAERSNRKELRKPVLPRIPKTLVAQVSAPALFAEDLGTT